MTNVIRRTRHPYTMLLLVLVMAFIWLLTHEGCAHPIGNLIASSIAFGFVPLRLLTLVEASHDQ